jgi:hypothetical protein
MINKILTRAGPNQVPLALSTTLLVSHRRKSVDARPATWLRLGIKSFKLLVMTEELDVLRIISERLRAADVPFMLTGSFALGYYGKPRMTRDLDFVVALMERHVDALVSAFSTDFYIDGDAALCDQVAANVQSHASGQRDQS